MRYSNLLKLKDLAALWRYHKNGTRDFAKGAVSKYREIAAVLEAKTGRTIKDLKILEIGSGQRFHNVALFHHFGARITGLDLEPVGYHFQAYWHMLRADGPGRLIKTLVRQIFFDRAYWREMEVHIEAPLKLRHLNLVCGDATRLPFPDNSFDAVISTAVWEHLPDVPAAVNELNRVLKPGGIARIAIHLFPSLSGGHQLDWQAPDKRKPPASSPWGHLRDAEQNPHVYLNRLRKKDDLAAFTVMEVESLTLSQSGEEWLSESLEQELKANGYERDELFETELLVLARKKIA